MKKVLAITLLLSISGASYAMNTNEIEKPSDEIKRAQAKFIGTATDMLPELTKNILPQLVKAWGEYRQGNIEIEKLKQETARVNHEQDTKVALEKLDAKKHKIEKAAAQEKEETAMFRLALEQSNAQTTALMSLLAQIIVKK